MAASHAFVNVCWEAQGLEWAFAFLILCLIDVTWTLIKKGWRMNEIPRATESGRAVWSMAIGHSALGPFVDFLTKSRAALFLGLAFLVFFLSKEFSWGNARTLVFPASILANAHHCSVAWLNARTKHGKDKLELAREDSLAGVENYWSKVWGELALYDGTICGEGMAYHSPAVKQLKQRIELLDWFAEDTNLDRHQLSHYPWSHYYSCSWMFPADCHTVRKEDHSCDRQSHTHSSLNEESSRKRISYPIW